MSRANQTDLVTLGARRAVTTVVHPVVVFSIVSHYQRRPAGQARVIGTLLGVDNEGVVEVRECFPVPHTEAEQVAVDMQYHRNIFELHQRANAANVIVGWYATGNEVTANSVMIHDFFYREMGRAPVHLTVDTTLRDMRLGVAAYMGVNVTLGKTIGSLFQPVRLTLSSFEAERVALSTLTRAKRAPPPGTLLTDLDDVESSIRDMRDMLQVLIDFVADVVAQRRRADARVGAALSDVVQALPKIDAARFEHAFNDSVNDLLMVSYLSKLAQTQLALSHAITTV
mmetsp:Transcript_18593/g.45760  ORF Transcript_18593/g.45760 Transcript_18593/m.45760 type:complete len:284 (+) Transcript_18593:47-898(+)